MNSAEKKKWAVVITGPARKSLKRIPSNDQARVRTAIDEMEIDPFQGTLNIFQDNSPFGDAWAIVGFSSV
jgi:mRNA-degrading endonuclease RelE of RelBE toxin-antitoxin system